MTSRSLRQDAATTGQARRPRADTGWRGRLRQTPGGALALKVGAFLLGLVFIALGVAALALPGPLTIPPMLLGLYIWSTEFVWADRLFPRAKVQGVEAWEQARKRPVISAITTVGGLIVAGVAIWAILHYDLVGRAKELVGL